MDIREVNRFSFSANRKNHSKEGESGKISLFVRYYQSTPKFNSSEVFESTQQCLSVKLFANCPANFRRTYTRIMQNWLSKEDGNMPSKITLLLTNRGKKNASWGIHCFGKYEEIKRKRKKKINDNCLN